MTPPGLIRLIGGSLIVLSAGLPLSAQAGDPLAAIQTRLTSAFKVSTLTADRSDIVTVGDVVQLHKPGLIMYAVTSPLPPANSYKNGKITQGWGGFGKDIMIGMSSGGGTTAADYPHRQFVPEEKCFLTDIQVQKDGVVLQLYSDPYDDVRYYASLKLPFPDKKTIPPADAELQAVNEVLTVVPQQAQDAQSAAPQPAAPPQSGPVMNAAQADQPAGISGEYTASSGSRLVLLPDGTFTKFVGNSQGNGKYIARPNMVQLIFPSTGSVQIFRILNGNLIDLTTRVAWNRTGDAPAPAPPAPEVTATSLPAIPPPPPPADTPAPTIGLGETRDQVIAAFGQPTKSAKIGAKEILSYKDMKVTLVNGKVTNVE